MSWGWRGLMPMTGDVPVGIFRKACHEAARRIPEVTFYELTEAAGRTAFHSAAMRDHMARHRIICRSRGGFVAFAAPPPFPGSCVLGFREPPDWSELFGWYGLRVLGLPALVTPLNEVDPGALDRLDREAMRRGRPGTLGELLFTWWGPTGASPARPGTP